MAITQLDTKFEDRLDELKSTAGTISNATLLAAQRKWQLSPANGWAGDLMDLVGLKDPYDRTDLNNNYETTMTTDDGTVGETMALKMQIDYTAADERAFRTRHSGYVRNRMHAASRRAGHGNDNGVFEGSVKPWITGILTQAADDPYP